MLELDGKRRDSRFILVQALDHNQVIALCPVGVSLLRWIDCVVLCCVVLCCVVLCCVVLCCGVLCCVVLCCVVSCYRGAHTLSLYL
jgi:hypothetical protein